MNQKIQGKFYPLKHEEFINLNKHLTQSELAVYLWLKTNDPYPKTIKTNKKIQTNQTVGEKTFFQEEEQPEKEDERPPKGVQQSLMGETPKTALLHRVGERRKGMREVVQNQVQDEESKKEKKLVSLAETLEEVSRDVVQEKTKIISPSKKRCDPSEASSDWERAPRQFSTLDKQSSDEIPNDLKEKLLELEIPLDSKVISAIASHDISQAYGAVAHVENTWDTITNPRGVFLFQLPKQPIEKLGSRYSEEIINNIKAQNQAIEEERKDPEYQKRLSEFFAQIRGRASLGKEKKTSEILDDDPWL